VRLDNANGVVKFVDDSLRDDKKLFFSGSNTYSAKLFSTYFKTYALFKRFRYLIFERRLAECRFEGIELFDKG
jgi:inorganic pyrophosphatase